MSFPRPGGVRLAVINVSRYSGYNVAAKFDWCAVGTAAIVAMAAGCSGEDESGGKGSGGSAASTSSGGDTGSAAGGPSGGKGGSATGGVSSGGGAAAGGVPAGGMPGAGGASGGSGGTTTTRFAVIGDFGDDFLATLGIGAEDQVATMVKSWIPDYIVTTGDNHYTTNPLATIDDNVGKYYAEFIGNYVGAYGPGSPENRFWPCIGNHEYGAGIDVYLDYFTLPNNERYYDVDMGLVHLYAVNSESQEPDGTDESSIQAAWLEERLAASTACFDVVYFHRPPYSSRGGGAVGLRWPFEEWGAEVVFNGHDHYYERFQVGGIPYIVVGNGGSTLYSPDTTVEESQVLFQGYGAVLVTVTDGSFTIESYGVDGALVDSYVIEKTCP